MAGGAVAYFIGTFVFYWWHRWRHESGLLWRLFHQIHPLRAGLTPEGGAVFTACCAIGEFVYHTNVTAPRWPGFVFQRPEMHRGATCIAIRSHPATRTLRRPERHGTPPRRTNPT